MTHNNPLVKQKRNESDDAKESLTLLLYILALFMIPVFWFAMSFIAAMGIKYGW